MGPPRQRRKSEDRSPNSEGTRLSADPRTASSFGFRSCFGFRPSAFISPLPQACLCAAGGAWFSLLTAQTGRDACSTLHPIAAMTSPSSLTRRQFVRVSALAAATAPAVLSARGQAAPAAGQLRQAPDSADLTHYQIGPQIWLRWNNEPLTSYRAHPTQKYPYFFPVSGPVSGLSVTSESSLPWPHHRSVFFACDRVNGANFWQEGLERGQIISKGPRVAEATRTSVAILDECEWRQPNQPAQMSDTRKFALSVPNARLRILDADIEWKAVVDVTIQKTNHGLFALRVANDLSPWGGGRLVSSEGAEGEVATFGKPARWCAFYGKRINAKGEPMEGIALMEHPGNPWNPCPWFTRDYGNISPMPFNWLTEPWKLAAGKSVQLKYRVVIFAGDPQEAGLERLYQDWSRA